MVGKMVEIMIIAGMENHVYKFNNVIRKQSQGGPIGLALTGEVADCYMVDWDQKFLLKMKSVGLNLIIYLRFKDDIIILGLIINSMRNQQNGNFSRCCTFI